MASPIDKREVLEINTVEESDEESFGACFGEDCYRPAKFEVWTKHPTEPDKRFVTELCKACKVYYAMRMKDGVSELR